MKPTLWYLGAMNDAMFVLDGPPVSGDAPMDCAGPEAIFGPIPPEADSIVAQLVKRHNAEINDVIGPDQIRKSPYFGEAEHPEDYDGPCGCDLCLSYGD